MDEIEIKTQLVEHQTAQSIEAWLDGKDRRGEPVAEVILNTGLVRVGASKDLEVIFAGAVPMDRPVPAPVASAFAPRYITYDRRRERIKPEQYPIYQAVSQGRTIPFGCLGMAVEGVMDEPVWITGIAKPLYEGGEISLVLNRFSWCPDPPGPVFP